MSPIDLARQEDTTMTTQPTNPSSVSTLNTGSTKAVMYAGTPITLLLVQGILSAAQSFDAAFEPERDSLSDNVILIDPAHRQSVATVGGRKLAALPMILQLMQENPSLPSAQSTDQIAATLTAASAMQKLSADLALLASHCGDTARVLYGSAWTGVSPGYAAAQVLAKHDQTLAPPVAAIQAVLKVGSKTDNAVQTAAKTQQAAMKAQTRADAAKARAVKAQATADALQHGTGDAVITQPAPTAPIR
jgi:hypothetical protein